MAGFTLIEVLIALAVSATALLGVAALGMQALRSTMHAQFISEATMLARDLEARCKLDRNSLYNNNGDLTKLPDYGTWTNPEPRTWLALVQAHLPGQDEPEVNETPNNCPAGLNVRCFTVKFTWTAPAISADPQNQGAPPQFTYTYPFAVILP